MEKKRWNIYYPFVYSLLFLFIGAGIMVLGIIDATQFHESPVVGYVFTGIGVLLQIIGVIILKMGQKKFRYKR